MADPDTVAAPLKADQEDDGIEVVRKRTLGNVRLRHHQTNEIILIPTPSRDPNDPLNWYADTIPNSLLHWTCSNNLNRPQWYKWYIATGTPKLAYNILLARGLETVTANPT